MGWCQVGSAGEPCNQQDCVETTDGEWSPRRPEGCLVLSLLEDPTAKLLVGHLLYPPIIRVRDEILPRSESGAVIVEQFDAHYDELVAVLRQDPELLDEVIDFLVTALPFARALTGERFDSFYAQMAESSVALVADHLTAGTIDWMSQILDRFRSAASPELAETIDRYQHFIPTLEGLSPREFLAALRKPGAASLLLT